MTIRRKKLMSWQGAASAMALFLWGALAHAGDTESILYQIEVLVFQQLDKSQLEDEYWRENPGYPKFEKAVKLLPSFAEDKGSDSLFFEGMEATSSVSNTMGEVVNPAASQKTVSTLDTLESEPLNNENKEGSLIKSDNNESPSQAYLVPYQELAQENMTLSPLYSRLEKSSDYQPMLLAGWAQLIEKTDQARAVYLGNIQKEASDDESYTHETQALTLDQWMSFNEGVAVSAAENEAAIELPLEGDLSNKPFFSEEASEEAQNPTEDLVMQQTRLDDIIEVPTVEGVVRVSKATYFHLDVDMAFNLPIRDTTGEVPYFLDDEWRAVFRLFETRRIKLGQINYFDHPAFGMLVRVEKVENITRGS